MKYLNTFFSNYLKVDSAKILQATDQRHSSLKLVQHDLIIEPFPLQNDPPVFIGQCDVFYFHPNIIFFTICMTLPHCLYSPDLCFFVFYYIGGSSGSSLVGGSSLVEGSSLVGGSSLIEGG